MDGKRLKACIYWVLPALGTAFGIWYILASTCNVVYSDYIRLVHTYLPDIYNIRKFLVADVLTRVPINYIGRIINVELFGYSLTFDRILGVIFLGLEAVVLGFYFRKKDLKIRWFLFIMVVMFSLNKWEMLVNGSGWCHFLAFAGFYYHEIVLDRVYAGYEKRSDSLLLMILPSLIIFFTAGPYCASYAVTLILAYAFCFIRNGRCRAGPNTKSHNYPVYILCALIPLLLYILSNAFVVEEYAGATGRSLFTILLEKPDFPFRFIFKSLAAILIGGEELAMFLEDGLLSDWVCYALGVFVLCGYLSAAYLYVRLHLYEETLVPGMLLFGGLFNHFLVFMARYIFEKEAYALNSSRYTLQFQVGIFGIIIVVALAGKVRRAGHKGLRRFLGFFCFCILLGNLYTTGVEVWKAPFRKEYFEARAERALTIPELSDEEFEAQAEELADYFEYWNGTDRIRKAFNILKENHWNVFRQEGGGT